MPSHYLYSSCNSPGTLAVPRAAASALTTGPKCVCVSERYHTGT